MAWDYIVVGAGSAGCVLAHRLSARPGNKVLLLEGGGSDTSPYLRVPAGEIKSILNPRFNWMYMSEPDPSLNGRDAMWPGGKVLGGSSSINGMIYLRGQREDYDDWGRLAGNTGAWSYRDVLPYFKRMESNPLGASEYHGDSGPLRVSDVPTPHPLVRVFIEGAQEIGIPFNADVNGATQEGAGPNQGTIRFGRRNSTARAYLRPVMDRANLRVETEARVDRVLFQEGRARTVVYSRGGERREATADGEIILSAGAIASPAILLRSGIGPGADLAALGIPVVADSPGVGNNLQEHPVAWVAGHVDISTYNTEVTVSGYVRHGLNWLLRGKGPAASPIAQAVAFVRTRPEEEERPDIQLHFTPTGYEFGPDGIKLLERPGVTIPANVCRPKSRSRLTLRSPDANEPPRIFSNLLGDEDDVRRMVDGCKISRAIFESAAFKPHFQGLFLPAPDVRSDAELEAYVRQYTLPAYHPAGTCKMGIDDRAVVDPELRVVGVERLRVIDASIMPIVTSSNTNAPTIMIGEKGSDLVLAGLLRHRREGRRVRRAGGDTARPVVMGALLNLRPF